MVIVRYSLFTDSKSWHRNKNIERLISLYPLHRRLFLRLYDQINVKNEQTLLNILSFVTKNAPCIIQMIEGIILNRGVSELKVIFFY